jgi:hypothetical protein
MVLVVGLGATRPFAVQFCTSLGRRCVPIYFCFFVIASDEYEYEAELLLS